MNDVGILGEKELQELGVVTDVVKQPSSAVEVENRMDVRSIPIEKTQSSLPRVSLCHLLMNIFYYNSSEFNSENFALDQLRLSLFTYFLVLSLVCFISY